MVVNGRKLAGEILAGLNKEFKKLPQLTVGAVLVGENNASKSFLKQKSKAAAAAGVNFTVFTFDKKIKTGQLWKEITALHNTKNIHGIIVQLPLPKHIHTEKIVAAISLEKDIDALSPKPFVLAPTAEAVKFIFQKYKVNYKNKHILIIGRGRLVGQPIYNWLTAQKSSREIMRSKTKIKIIDIKQKNQLPTLAREADIIISGVGKAGLIKGKMIKRGAILIDFGFSRKNGKISGDFDFESCVKKAELITPVPGGIGPIMVAMLFRNLFTLCRGAESDCLQMLFRHLLYH